MNACDIPTDAFSITACDRWQEEEVGNAEMAESKGLEVGGTWLATEKLILDFTILYADVTTMRKLA